MTGGLFCDGALRADAPGGPLLATILAQAGERGGERLRTADLLAAVIECAPAVARDALRGALVPGARTSHLTDSIEVYAPRSASPTAFDGRRERCTPEALAALDGLDVQLAAGDRGDVAAELLLSCVLTHLAPDDRQGLLGILDADSAVRRIERRVEELTRVAEPLLDAESGRLRDGDLAPATLDALRRAAAHAGRLGYDKLLAPHCLLGLLDEAEGAADQIVRLEGLPGIGPVQLAAAIEDGFRIGDSGRPPALDGEGIAAPTLATLDAARRRARLDSADRIETHHLLAALLADPPRRLRSVLEAPGIDLDVARMLRRAEEYAQRLGVVRPEPVLRLASSVLPSEDLTHRARNDELEPALHVERHLEPALRALARRSHSNVLLRAAPGVGATTILREIARRCACGDVTGLEGKRFLRVDCATVTPEDSKDKLERVLAHVAGRGDVILCLDGLGPLLRGPRGTSHKPLLREALAAGQASVVAVISPGDYRELLAGDPALRDMFTPIEVDEPPVADATDIVALHASELEREYAVQIAPGAVRRAVALMADYALSERLPVKAIGALRRACEDATYARRQNGHDGSDGPSAADTPSGGATVDEADVLRAVVELTGISIDRLSGFSGKRDYERDLAASVVGQPEAVRAVAAELRRINAGLVEPGRPASVMLFAGLTGVGKTELAKTLAELYSASRRLLTYTMGNFTERHTVASILGSPPGFIGHEQGGRLINDLNADPYSVFLLDEAEKAHPDVWKPFLNLFDEGWIVDQRGTKAYADRAVFILASNSGQETIARMWRAGSAPEEIALRVREALAQERNTHSGELVFPPEFLARLGRIIVFRPLEPEAMAGVCRLVIERVTALWQRRDKTLTVAGELVDHIAAEAHRLDEAARFTEGGRVARRLVEDLVQAPITAALDADPEGAARCDLIAVDMSTRPGGPPEIHVTLRAGGRDDG